MLRIVPFAGASVAIVDTVAVAEAPVGAGVGAEVGAGVGAIVEAIVEAIVAAGSVLLMLPPITFTEQFLQLTEISSTKLFHSSHLNQTTLACNIFVIPIFFA